MILCSAHGYDPLSATREGTTHAPSRSHFTHVSLALVPPTYPEQGTPCVALTCPDEYLSASFVILVILVKVGGGSAEATTSAARTCQGLDTIGAPLAGEITYGIRPKHSRT